MASLVEGLNPSNLSDGGIRIDSKHP